MTEIIKVLDLTDFRIDHKKKRRRIGYLYQPQGALESIKVLRVYKNGRLMVKCPKCGHVWDTYRTRKTKVYVCAICRNKAQLRE